MKLLLACCLLLEDDLHFFSIEIDSARFVDSLLDEVNKTLKSRNREVPFDSLRLYKTDVLLRPSTSLFTRVSDWCHAYTAQATLDPTRTLNTLFTAPLSSQTLHIIAYIAPNLPPLQHDRRHNKLVFTAPSTVAQMPNYKSMQSYLSKKVLDDRPAPDLDVAPISLLYSGFGNFEDIVSLQKATDTEQFKAPVDKFAEDMAKFYDDEDKRRDAGIPLLNNIFAIHNAGLPLLFPSTIGSVRSDGLNIGPHGVPLAVVEFKNELTNIVALPHNEAAGYVAHLHDQIDNTLLPRWRIPCLGITIIVRFYAIVLLGHQYRVVSLTPGLSCLPSASGGTEREALYRAFAAAAELQICIFADTVQIPPSPIPTDALRLPAVSKLRKHCSPDEYIAFEIQQCHPSRQRNRHLYLARPLGSADVKTLILIKFSQTYCIELHEYCFRQGHALQILGFERLPGGWFGIAMAFPSDAFPLDATTATTEFDPETFRLGLTNLVEGFHGQGFVHGDLRVANILITGHRFWLIDFDWGVPLV